MSKSGFGLAALLWIAAMGSAQAVYLDIGGRGQVLLYPYYTVNNSQQTLLSVTNTSSVAQAAKVRFHEGFNGRDVLSFNIFLSPFDSWTATVFALRDAGINSDGAAILSRDTSCTAPLFSEDGTSIGGTPYVAFSGSNFDPSFADDGGPYTIDRTREGMIEIIAMANLGTMLTAAVSHGTNGSAPTGCSQVRNLVGNEAEVSSAPSGGLMGTVSIINGGQGTYLSSRAEALGGFTKQALFTSVDSMLGRTVPNLSNANDGVGATGLQATAHVFDSNGKSQNLTYPGLGVRSSKVDAVSAVLMADRVYNEFQISTALAAASDWVLTMPTKRFYVDPLFAGFPSGSPLFPKMYDGSPSANSRYSPAGFDNMFYSRDSASFRFCGVVTSGPCPKPLFRFVSNVFVVRANSAGPQSLVLGSQLIDTRPMSPTSSTGQSTRLDSGHMALDLYPTFERHQLPASAEGKVLRGLPVIGFWASNIVNANAINGVLANYAAAVRHATSVTCVKASDGTPCD